MFLDFDTQVSTAQAIADGTAVLSTKSIDLQAASRLGNVCDFGFVVQVSAMAADSVLVEVVAADNAALDSNLVVLGSALLTATGLYFVKASALTKKRHVGLRYDTTGATPTATVTAAVGACPFPAHYQA